MVKRTSTRFIAPMIEGAKPSEIPGFIPPQLATLKLRAPAGDKWIHEIKFDGYRLQIYLNKGKVKIFTRNGHDWTNRFHLIAESFDIPVERAVFDGEVVVIKDGRTNFSELQAALASGRQRSMAFYAFDLLFLEGFDLRNSPQIERKRVLKMLFDETRLARPIVYSDHLLMDSNEMYAHACKLNWEGIISKNAEAPYRSGRNEGWLKIKCA
jgi:bifunctional non-homologous end joining protein LigD